MEALASLYPAATYGDRRVAARDAALSHAAATQPAGGIPLAGDNLVYGEFDLSFFEQLLQLAEPQPGDHFIDLGSGVGRIVLAAALLQPKLGLCQGIEILPELHEQAVAARVSLDELAPSLPIAPCEYSAYDLYSEAATEALSSADILFSYSVTWERDEQGRLTDLSRVLAERLKPGARIITVDVKLLNSVDKVNFVPMASLEGANEETGPASVGHIFRLENA